MNQCTLLSCIPITDDDVQEEQRREAQKLSVETQELYHTVQRLRTELQLSDETLGKSDSLLETTMQETADLQDVLASTVSGRPWKKTAAVFAALGAGVACVVMTVVSIFV